MKLETKFSYTCLAPSHTLESLTKFSNNSGYACSWVNFPPLSYLANLRLLLDLVILLVCPPGTFSFDAKTQNSDAHSLHWLTESLALCHALLTFILKEPKIKSENPQTDMEVYISPAYGI
jgi:hypothetical protein